MMDLPLIIAILAFLAFLLLPVLDRSAQRGDQRQGSTRIPDPYRTLGERVSNVKPRLLNKDYRRFDSILGPGDLIHHPRHGFGAISGLTWRDPLHPDPRRCSHRRRG